MPLITFETGSLSDNVKSELMQKLTDVASEVTGIHKGAFFVAIRELPDENIAVGGKTVKEMKIEAGRC